VLRFTEDEIDSLFREVYSDPLAPEELAVLERRTEGWAASLQLVEVSLRERVGPDRRAFIESIAAESDSDLFAFLAEEVLDQQNEETRNFLLSTSILGQVTPELAERMTGVSDGGRVLADLEQRGLFTNRLGDGDRTFRYHGLFRDFLERRLALERSQAEIVGLHIHAASYYETSLQWPQAIHHYLKAGLQRQAARLIAKYGEAVVESGRLGLIDSWLGDLPTRVVHDNARLSLLQGEALGTIRGDWAAAAAALERGRSFFKKKGDRRMVALADLKLSTLAHYRGDGVRSAEAAARGLSVALESDRGTRLRLRGNLAITSTWLESLARTEQVCEELILEAESDGLFHYAAIGRHNLGLVQQWMGRLSESLENFEEADRFWGSLPSSPYGDNGDFVTTLLAQGDLARARTAAQNGISRTRSWPRPHAEATHGQVQILLQSGEFGEATRVLRRLLAKRTILGGLTETVAISAINALVLSEARKEDLEWAGRILGESAANPGLSAQRASALALAAHGLGTCSGECKRARQELHAWEARGARFLAACGYVQMAPLLAEHDQMEVGAAVDALRAAHRVGALSYLRWWTRRFGSLAHAMARHPGGLSQVQTVAELDMHFWRPILVSLLPALGTRERAEVLHALREQSTAETARSLLGIPGADVADLRRDLLRASAERLYVRAFGPLTIHRGSWDGPEIIVDKRRLRLLLGILVANRHRSLTREMAMEALWPDHDPVGGVNNLNQAVFQLRRTLNGGSTDPDKPQYVLSSPDALTFDADLVFTDLEEVRRISRTLGSATSDGERLDAATAMLGLIRGEFLADLRYEEWTNGIQVSVAAEVRDPLLAIANARPGEMPSHLSLRAAELLAEFDPYDESAHVAMARKLHEIGRRAAARKLLTQFAEHLEEEMQAPASPAVRDAIAEL
jgi:DNA-binding SARP family transcriptional activator